MRSMNGSISSVRSSRMLQPLLELEISIDILLKLNKGGNKKKLERNLTKTLSQLSLVSNSLLTITLSNVIVSEQDQLLY